MKREDRTGLGFGGNKLRNLDYMLSEALDADADTLVSGGVVQSNNLSTASGSAASLANPEFVTVGTLVPDGFGRPHKTPGASRGFLHPATSRLSMPDPPAIEV